MMDYAIVVLKNEIEKEERYLKKCKIALEHSSRFEQETNRSNERLQELEKALNVLERHQKRERNGIQVMLVGVLPEPC